MSLVLWGSMNKEWEVTVNSLLGLAKFEVHFQLGCCIVFVISFQSGFGDCSNQAC